MAFDLLGTLNSVGAFRGTVGNADPSYNEAPVGAPPKAPGFFSNVAHSVATIAGGIGHAAVNDVAGIGQHAVNLVKGEAGDLNNFGQQTSLAHHNQMLQQQQNHLIKQYTSRQISKTQYNQGLKSLLAAGEKQSAALKTLATSKNYTMGQAAKDYLPVAGAALTLAAPFAAPVEAAAEGASLGVRAATKVGQALDSNLAAGSAAGKDLVGSAAKVGGAAVRNALVTQPTIQSGQQFAGDIKNKNYGDAALQAGLFAGIPLAGKYIAPAVGEAASAVKNKMFGVRSFLDEIPTAGKSIGDYVSANSSSLVGKSQQTAMDVAKVFQQHNLNETKGNVGNAVQKYVEWLGGLEKSATMSAPQHLEKFQQFADDVTKIRQAATNGTLLKEDGTKYTAKEIGSLWAGRLDQGEKATLVNALKAAPSAEARQKVAQTLADEHQWGQNSNLRDQVIQAASKPTFEKDINKTFQGTRSLGDVPGLTNGHFTIQRGTPDVPEQVAIPTAAQSGDIVRGKQASGVLGKVGSAVTGAGLSPLGTDTNKVQGLIRDHFVQNVEANIPNAAGKGGEMLNSLYKGTEGRIGAYDPRLLSKNEIASILNVDTGTAGDVRKALDNAYKSVSLPDRGFGSKIMDYAIGTPGEKQYLRAQSALKFSNLNPFYQGKVAFKSALIANAESGGHGMNRVEPEIKSLVKGIAQPHADTSAIDYLGGEVPNVKPGIVGKFQQNQAENMVQKILQNNKSTVGDLESNPALKQHIEQAVQSVYGYPKGGYLDSNLAKTLNVAIFPSRFETKVAAAGVQFLKTQPPIVRAALINDMLGAKQYLDSPQGQKWQQDNSELLGIVKYFTPITTLGNIMSTLGTKSLHASDLGELGGLPLGVITQVLQHQGVPMGPLGSSVYHDPKTGQIVPEKLPTTTKARIQTGLTDLVNSMFSYPGRQMGLSSKSNVVQTTLPFLKPDKGSVKTVGGSTKAPTVGTPVTPRALQAGYVAPKIPQAPKVTVTPIYKTGTRRGRIRATVSPPKGKRY